MAWLNVIPRGENRPRHELIKNIKFPDEPLASHLSEYFLMLIKGTDNITFTELSNFIKLTGIDLTPTDCNILVEMGSIYRSFKSKAANPDCENPLWTDKDRTNHKMLKIKGHMASLKAKRKQENG